MNDTSTPEIKDKTITRLLAIQIIYQFYFYNCDRTMVHDIIKYTVLYHKKEYINYHPSITKTKIRVNFLHSLIVRFLKTQLKIETLANEITNKCSYKPCLDALSIIKTAITEITCIGNVHPKIVVSEYTNIASSILPSNKISLINAVLDKIAHCSYTFTQEEVN